MKKDTGNDNNEGQSSMFEMNVYSDRKFVLRGMVIANNNKISQKRDTNSRVKVTKRS